MYIKRVIEKYIISALESFKVVGVYGSRQVGKSTTLKHILPEIWDKVTFDDEKELDVALSDRALFLKNHHLPLFIDEVQYAPNVFKEIKKCVDESDECGQFCLSGSEGSKIIVHSAESLAGRICVVNMPSLMAREIAGVDFGSAFIPSEDYIEKRSENLKKYSDIWNIIFTGSMPYLWQNSKVNRESYYRSFLNTYISRDVAEILNIKNKRQFFKFITILASCVSRMLNYTSIANDLALSVNTIKEWTSVLETIGIIKLIYPFENNISKRLVKTPKVYFMDTGLVCYLVGWNSVESVRNGANSGELFENFVVSEVVKSFLNAGKDTSDIYYYRDRDKREIDLLILHDNILYPIEIKKGTKPVIQDAKHFTALNQFSDKQKACGIILCQCDRKLILSDNLIALPLEYI